MIRKVTFNTKTPGKPFSWISEALKHRTIFEFTPGVNLIIGRNGAGKSTFLRILSGMFHCTRSGRSVVNHASCSDIKDQDYELGIYKEVTIDHDGGPVSYIDAEFSPGSIHGYPDDDFFDLWKVFCKGNPSSGQTAMRKHEILVQKPPRSMVWKKHTSENDWRDERRDKTLKEFFAGTAPLKNMPLILMDEPCRSLDIDLQVQFWRSMREISLRTDQQVIIVTHSPLGLQAAADFNVVEMTPGYLKECQKALRAWREA